MFHGKPQENPRSTVKQLRNTEPLPNKKSSFFRAPTVGGLSAPEPLSALHPARSPGRAAPPP
eukprot:3075514-Pyramimonas_sp.AAC.1